MPIATIAFPNSRYEYEFLLHLTPIHPHGRAKSVLSLTGLELSAVRDSHSIYALRLTTLPLSGFSVCSMRWVTQSRNIPTDCSVSRLLISNKCFLTMPVLNVLTPLHGNMGREAWSHTNLRSRSCVSLSWTSGLVVLSHNYWAVSWRDSSCSSYLLCNGRDAVYA